MNKLNMKMKISYGFGDLGCCLMNYMISYYLSFYCTVFLKIPLAFVGVMLVLVQVWDAVNDIFIGNLIDITRTRDGKARPWIKWFMVPCCVTGALIFACPPDWSVYAKCAWVFVSYFAFVLFYTTVNLPYGSMLSLMTQDSAQRSSLSTFRYIGAYVGILVVSCGALPLVKLIGGDDGRVEGYKMVMILFSAVALILFFFLYRNCEEIDSGDNFISNAPEKKAEKAKLSDFGRNLSDLFKNKAWLLVFIIGVFYWTRYPFYGTSMTYYYRFYLGIDETASSIMYTIGTITGLVLIPFVPKMVEKWDYKKTLTASCVISGVAMLGGFLSGQNVTLAVICFTIEYTAESVVCPVTLCMIADALEYGELKTGKKLAGLGYAANSFCTKAGPALGGFLTSMLFVVGKLDTNADIGGAQPSSALMVLRMAMWVIPAALSFIMIIFIQKYPLNKAEYEKIVKQLEVKHEGQ